MGVLEVLAIDELSPAADVSLVRLTGGPFAEAVDSRA